VLWTAIACGAVCAATGVAAPMVWVRTPYVTGQGQPVDQPVKFDHRHHAADDGIDCLYCHENATRAPYAGVPPTARCMGCHAQIWTQSPELDVVRASFFEDRPIVWRRVNALPKFVYFDHSVHLASGVHCEECHGRVDRMASVYQAEELSMSWCLGCHRARAPAFTHCSTCHR
jgi:hypothetical protein